VLPCDFLSSVLIGFSIIITQEYRFSYMTVTIAYAVNSFPFQIIYLNDWNKTHFHVLS